MKYSAENKPQVCMMTQSTCYRGTRVMEVKGVLWHSTGADNPTLKRYVQPDDDAPDRAKLMALLGKNLYGNDWNHSERQAGLNGWIGKLADGSVAAVQTLPWTFRPWGCGSGAKGSCNNGWIQFEICEDDLSDPDYFSKVYKEACELTAYLCDLYGIDPQGSVTVSGVRIPTILCHQDSYNLGFGSNHSDVLHWFKRFGKTMADVRRDVAALLLPEPSAGQSYVVQKGDTLSAIARKFGVNWKSLASYNGIPDPDLIKVGQVLKIPQKITAGDTVRIIGTRYYSGAEIPDWVLQKEWIVYSAPEGSDRIVLDQSADRSAAIRSPFRRDDLVLVKKG